eukprot:scaffold39396_cov39-Phaeocystis_antarctica.AAC.1
MSSATTPRAARAHRDRHATSTMQPPEAPTRLQRRAKEGGVHRRGLGWRAHEQGQRGGPGG